jgi:EGF domain/Calcium-binding EGF domain
MLRKSATPEGRDLLLIPRQGCLGKCHPNAACTINGGSYACICNPGYFGDGINKCDAFRVIFDVDECAENTHNCHVDAICTNTLGSFTCTCKSGTRGNGTDCKDIDECYEYTRPGVLYELCRQGSTCVNTLGSFMCKDCPPGYDEFMAARTLMNARVRQFRAAQMPPAQTR